MVVKEGNCRETTRRRREEGQKGRTVSQIVAGRERERERITDICRVRERERELQVWILEIEWSDVDLLE